VDKLSHMSNSQQSIQTVSHWIMYHRKRYVQSVKIWEKELYQASASKKMIYIYLANDIMQSSRKKGGEFIKEFSKVIKSCMIHVHRENSENHKPILRLLDIWDERKVVPTPFIEEIRKALKGEATQPKELGPSDTLNKTTIPSLLVAPISQEADPLHEALQQVEELEVTNDIILERVSSINHDLFNTDILNHVSNQSSLSEVAAELEEAFIVYSQYKKHLDQDYERRSKLISVLSEYLEKQETILNRTNAAQEDCSKQLLKYETIKGELKSMYQQLSLGEDHVKKVGNMSPTSPLKLSVSPRTPTSPPSSPHTPTEPPIDTEIVKRQKVNSMEPVFHQHAQMYVPSNAERYNSVSQAWNPLPHYKL